MAFMKYATAAVVSPHVSRQKWQMVRTAGRQYGKVAKTSNPNTAGADLSDNLVDRATGIFGTAFDPTKYLLTHATIVCSVDTYTPTGAKTGRVLEDGFRVNRKYADYRIKANCDKYINNNMDAWSRGVLLKSFQTFIGGHNFVEHVQVEDLSKGRIIDAVARDIGESVYIDILIATDRKHTDLVAAIESGKMSTLSMGCTVDGTICTKCGHWAADETEMCPHIKYEKGNTFFDETGRMHRVAELCGHEDLDPTGGVHFIEASWVETPAFTGAVLRNVIEPTDAIAEKAARVLSTPPKQWQADAYQKAAKGTVKKGTDLRILMEREAEDQNPTVIGRVRPLSPLTYPDVMGIGKRTADEDRFLVGWEDEPEDEAAEPAPEPEANPLQDVEKELTRHIMDRVKKRIKDDLSKDEAPAGDSMAPNDTLQKEAARQARVQTYKAGLDVLVRTASSDVALMNAIAEFNQSLGINIPVPLYRTALKVGSVGRYKSEAEFAKACRSALGRQASEAEIRTLVRLGHLLARRGQAHRGINTTPGSRH